MDVSQNQESSEFHSVFLLKRICFSVFIGEMMLVFDLKRLQTSPKNRNEMIKDQTLKV